MRLYVRKTAEPATLAPDGDRRATQREPEPEPSPPASGPPSAAPEPAEPEDGLHYLTAPMVGVFYASPRPGEPPFVTPGDTVEEDDIVCIIEVMKLFNSIAAGVRGRVIDILAENGAMVEYGQRLIAIEPDAGL